MCDNFLVCPKLVLLWNVSTLIYAKLKIRAKLKIYGQLTIYGQLKIFGQLTIYGQLKIFGQLNIYAKLKIYGQLNIYGMMHCAQTTAREGLAWYGWPPSSIQYGGESNTKT